MVAFPQSFDYRNLLGLAPTPSSQQPVSPEALRRCVVRGYTSSNVVEESTKLRLGLVTIRALPGRALTSPLDAVLEANDDGFLASLVDLPVYAEGDTMIEALDGLRHQVLELWGELKDSDDLSAEWSAYRSVLAVSLGQ